ncbi:hypothetical protein B296_00006019, partial [Ensete ventricosum]
AGRLRDGSRREKNERKGGREPRVRAWAVTVDGCGFGRSSSIGRFEAFASTCNLRGGGRPNKYKKHGDGRKQHLVFVIIVSRLISDERSSHHEALLKAYKRDCQPTNSSRQIAHLPRRTSTAEPKATSHTVAASHTSKQHQLHACPASSPSSFPCKGTAQPTDCSLQRVIAYVTV